MSAKNPTVEHFLFLDNLRESGVTNMWGAGPYLQDEFNLEEREASPILFAWMKTFSRALTPEERIAKVVVEAR